MRSHRLFEKVGHIHVFADIKRTNLGFFLRFFNTLMSQCCTLFIHFKFVILNKSISLALKNRQLLARIFEAFLHLRDESFIASISNVAFCASHRRTAMLQFVLSSLPLFLFAYKMNRQTVRQVISRLGVVRRPRNNQRRSRFVDQRRIDFVHDCKVTGTLHLIDRSHLHIVAQIIKSKFARCSIDHIAGVCGSLFARSLHMHWMNRTDCQTDGIEKWESPITISLNEIVIHGDDMDLLLFRSRQVTRHRTNDCFSFACFHFGDTPFAQNNSANDLHIEWSCTKGWTAIGEDFTDCLIDHNWNVDQLPTWNISVTTAKISRRLTRSSRRHNCLCFQECFASWFWKALWIKSKSWIKDVADTNRAIHCFSSTRKDLRNHVVWLFAFSNTLTENMNHSANL